MPAIKPLTIADGQVTPVNHIFTPANPQTGTLKNLVPARWQELNGDSFVGARRITMSVVPDFTVNGVSKVRIVVADPVIATPSQGCCVDTTLSQVAYTDFVNINFNIASNASSAKRKDILAFAKNVLASAEVKAAVETLEAVY